eukprot:gene45311-55434_t
MFRFSPPFSAPHAHFAPPSVSIDAEEDFNFYFDDGLTTCSSADDLVKSTSTASKGGVTEKAAKQALRKRRSTMTAQERREEDKALVKRVKFAFGRLMRRDIRRHLALMHNNVLNSLDTSLIRRFFCDFARPDLQCINKLASSIYSLPLGVLTSREEVISLWCEYIVCKPDAMSKLLSNQVTRYYSTQSSEIRCMLHFRATNVTVLDTPALRVARNTDDFTRAKEDLADALVKNEPVPFHTAQHVLLTPVNVVASFTFTLDDQHGISAIEVDARFVPDPQLSQHYDNYQKNCSTEVIVKNDGKEVILPSEAAVMF